MKSYWVAHSSTQKVTETTKCQNHLQPVTHLASIAFILRSNLNASTTSEPLWVSCYWMYYFRPILLASCRR